MTVRNYFEAWIQSEIAGRKAQSIVHKFGRDPAVGTSYAPVSVGGVYQTPQVGSATKVRVKAGNANDTAAGSGARKVSIQGLDETGTLRSEELVTAGESAGAVSTYSYIRIFRAFVSESGAYATSAAGSHAAAIVIENAAGNADWLTIDATDFARGQSEIAAYTVPLGFEAFVTRQDFYVDSNKTVDLIFFQRQSILDTDAPYEAMRTIKAYVGVVGEAESANVNAPLGPFPQCTDIGYMAKAAQAASVSIDFEIILVKSND